MNLENLMVVHKSFGEGTVVEQRGKYMRIRFGDAAEKTFVYPDAFEKYLSVADEALLRQILEDLCAVREERQKIADRKQEENARAMTHGIVIPGKEVSLADSDDEEGKSSGESDEG